MSRLIILLCLSPEHIHTLFIILKPRSALKWEDGVLNAALGKLKGYSGGFNFENNFGKCASFPFSTMGRISLNVRLNTLMEG